MLNHFPLLFDQERVSSVRASARVACGVFMYTVCMSVLLDAQVCVYKHVCLSLVCVLAVTGVCIVVSMRVLWHLMEPVMLMRMLGPPDEGRAPGLCGGSLPPHLQALSLSFCLFLSQRLQAFLSLSQ